MTNYHITVYGADRLRWPTSCACTACGSTGRRSRRSAHGLQVDGVGDDAAIGRLTEAGYRVERHEDVDEAAQESLAARRNGESVRR